MNNMSQIGISTFKIIFIIYTDLGTSSCFQYKMTGGQPVQSFHGDGNSNHYTGLFLIIMPVT